MKPSCCVLALLAAAWGAQACTGSREAYHPVNNVVGGDNPVVIAAVTGAAVTTYAVGGGCRIADCPADTICNPGTERCERIECGGPPAGAEDPCPPSSQCSSSTGTCVPF